MPIERNGTRRGVRFGEDPVLRLLTNTVVLTREHRDAVWDAVETHMSAEDVATSPGDRGRLGREIRALTVCGRLFDQLGWQQHGDRDAYQLEVDADIAWFMQEMAQRARESLEDSRLGLVRDGRDCPRCFDMDLDVMDAARLVRDATAGA
jgi:hypothetical protein